MWKLGQSDQQEPSKPGMKEGEAETADVPGIACRSCWSINTQQIDPEGEETLLGLGFNGSIFSAIPRLL